MEIMPSINFNTWPFWAVAIFWISMKVYNDILKPRFDKKLETERKNLEIKKFNEDSERWKKVLGYVEQSVIDILSLPQAQIVTTISIQSAGKDFILKLFDILDKNDIKNPIRQKVIKEHLKTFLTDQKNRLSRALSQLKYDSVSLATYIDETTNEHTLEFLNSIFEMFFSDTDTIRKKQDLVMLVESHYNNHVNEALEYLIEKNDKNEHRH